MARRDPAKKKTYVVEHLEPELGPWSTLEYLAIAQESQEAGASFYLSSVPEALSVPAEISDGDGVIVERRGVEELYQDSKDRVCLLDPAAPDELSPDDAVLFDVFLFGGILGDDPPRDRTSELRKKGFQGRRLGPIQMTTDTAVRVTRMVIQQKGSRKYIALTQIHSLKGGKVRLKDISYVDHPELRIDEHESTEMPFRYVVNSDGYPIMPKGMVELIKQDSEKGFGDLL